MPLISTSPKPFRLPVQPYPCHPRIVKFFAEHVNKPFDEHPRTRAWVNEVLRNDWGYHSREILERGRVSFLKDKNELTPRDQVIVYCHYYMHQHAASGMH